MTLLSPNGHMFKIRINTHLRPCVVMKIKDGSLCDTPGAFPVALCALENDSFYKEECDYELFC